MIHDFYGIRHSAKDPKKTSEGCFGIPEICAFGTLARLVACVARVAPADSEVQVVRNEGWVWTLCNPRTS